LIGCTFLRHIPSIILVAQIQIWNVNDYSFNVDSFIQYFALDVNKPLLKLISQYEYPVENETVALQCDVEASETPTFQWYYNNAIVHTRNESFWLIQNVQREMEGSYRCEVLLYGRLNSSNQIIITVSCK